MLRKKALIFIWISMPFLLFGQETLYRYTENQMGTQFNILLYGEQAKTKVNAEMAFAEIERVNQIFSNYHEDSELGIINQSKGWQQISTEMAEIIAYSELLNKFSEGAFDIKIGQAIDAWKKAIHEKTILHDKEIKQLKRKSNWINFKEKDGKFYIKLSRQTKLDFGGIAKGYAVDKAFEVLIQHKAVYCLIDGGGDMRLGKKPPHSQGWKIGLHNSEGENMLLENCAIATSGHDYQFMEIGGSIYTHIIDPKTINAKSIKRGVTVISDTCQSADALATALSINPKEHELKKHFQFQVRIKEGEDYLVKDF